MLNKGGPAFWASYGLVMGFLLFGSFWWASQPISPVDKHPPAAQEQKRSAETSDKKHEAEAALALYTLWLTAFTGILAGGTLALWFVTVLTLRHARVSHEEQLRPYVNVSEARFEWMPNFGVRVVVHCLNSGQSPATFFEVGAISKVYDRGDKGWTETIPDDLNYKIWSSLGAGRTETALIYGDLFTKHAEEVFIGQRDKFFFIAGRVRYGDVFGSEYESEFIYFTTQCEPHGASIKMSRATGRLKTYQKTNNGNRAA
jgi:hypothetical protein